jgi:copper chaperone CopZ
MALQEMSVEIRGVSPLLMHNGQTADPLNKFTKQMKAITGKRKKTEEDYAEMSKIEWHAGLYVDKAGDLIIPSTLLEASIQDGAKKSKLGKAFKSAVFINDDAKLDIGTKKKAVDLWGDDNYRDVRGVRVGQSRVMRTRPVFNSWSCKFTLYFDDEQVNDTDVVRAIEDAGSKSGLGDFRPRFGRFEVVV